MNEKRTVRVRIAVAVSADGRCVAAGGDKIDYADPEKLLENWGFLEAFSAGEKLRCVWVEADVPLPDPPENTPIVEGTVSP